MEVWLTDKVRSAMGWGPDRLTARVSDDRAYVWMSGGWAVPDKGFMSLYQARNPEPETNRPKKENADSRKAKRREKAVTEG